MELGSAQALRFAHASAAAFAALALSSKSARRKAAFPDLYPLSADLRRLASARAVLQPGGEVCLCRTVSTPQLDDRSRPAVGKAAAGR